MSLLVRTTRFTRGRLPHWEVEHGRYFVTVRCHDSLPAHVVARLREITECLQTIAPASHEFAQFQRRYFLTMEKYLDAGHGESPLRNPNAAEILIDAFTQLSFGGILVPHFTIMPNHWHAMFASADGSSIDLHAIITRLKGRTSRAINTRLNRTGPLWQREWFDRWMRTDAEWDRCVDYIHHNPVKAGLVRHWREHAWTK